MQCQPGRTGSRLRAFWKRPGARRLIAIVLVPTVLIVLPISAAACSSGEDFALLEAPMEPMADRSLAQAEGANSAAGWDADEASDEASIVEDDGGGAVTAGSVAKPAGRKLIFRAYMTLTVEDVRAALGDAQLFVEARGGYVEESRIYGSGGAERAEVTYRVPQESYDDTREHLREAAIEVNDEQSGRSDVTQQYVDLEARLENLEAAEIELREILSQARESGGTTEDVLAIHRELTRVRGEIESLQAQRDALADQVALSTIYATFEPPPAAPGDVVGAWRPGRVFREALSDLAGALKGLVNAGIYLTVAILPILTIFAVVIVAITLAARAIRRRMRG